MKITKIILAGLFLSFSVLAFAGNENNLENTNKSQATVTGKVMDFQSGEALAGATVNIEGTNLIAYTDLDGNFTFPSLKPGTYTIKVCYISYKPSLLENINIQSGTPQTFEVKLEAAE